MSEVIVKRAEGKLKSNLNKLNVDLGDQYSKSWMDKDAFGGKRGRSKLNFS